MKIGFVGLGYVGLTTAVCMAYRGFTVVGVDIEDEKVQQINEGITPLTEPGLQPMLKRVLKAKRFEATTDFKSLSAVDVIFITVGTPSKPDGSIDLTHVSAAAANIGEAISKTKRKPTVVVKSTVIPGTTRNLVKTNIEKKSHKTVGTDFNLCANPEFLREGSAVQDTFQPDRIVVGDDWEGGARTLKRLYTKFYGERMPPLLITNTVNAEMIKYANNVFLAARISLINEFANICQRIPGADIKVVAKGVGMDRRIGPHFLNAGLGYGGSCFPKDVKAVAAYAKELGENPVMIEAVEKVNQNQPLKAVELAEQLIGDLRGKKAAVLGLAFKPNTDDIREAVSLKIIDKLLEKGCEVTVYDPAAMENVAKIYLGKITYAKTPTECLQDADFCIIATEWKIFEKLKPIDFIKHMKQPVVIDGRRIYDPEKYAGKITYVGIGSASLLMPNKRSKASPEQSNY